jgi:hypothetical protein
MTLTIENVLNDQNLYPHDNQWFGFGGDGEKTYKNLLILDGSDKPTEKSLTDALAKRQSDFDAQEYSRNRASEYPSLLELTVALYDTDDKSAVEAKRAAVKAKYPKPE